MWYSTSQENIKYGKNSGVVKLDYQGNVKALWTLPNTGKDQENEYIYTTNVVFGDTEETVYVLCGISNPSAALNSVYGYANVPTKINYDVDANLQDQDTAYFHKSNLNAHKVYPRDPANKYKVDITNYSFANYPKIKIYKLNANDLKQYSNGKYDFEFPPAATGKLNDPATASDEYDKTIIAGFGGGQHLNYWSTNSTWITNYKTRSDQSISLMNSSFFHYLQFGQTFDYVGSDQFIMVPTYIGIDSNLGGLYSLINEGMSHSLSSLSSYPSLYNVLYKYKGKPSADINTKTVDFSRGTVTPTLYQYQYLDGLGKKVNVTNDSEFALKENVINLILLSVGYFMPNHEWNIDTCGADMEKTKVESAPGYFLNIYGIVCFSPLKNKVVDKYKLYIFNKNSFFWIPVSHLIIENMIIDKGDDGEKRYRFLVRTCFSDANFYFPDFYNGSSEYMLFYGVRNPDGDRTLLGFTWDEFANTYDTIQNSQFNATQQNIDLTGVNANSKDWSDRYVNKEYYDNLNSVLTVKNYIGDDNNTRYPLGWYADTHFEVTRMSYDVCEISPSINFKDYGIVYSKFSSSSGSRYVNYGDKILLSDVAWANKLVVIDDKYNFSDLLKKNYKSSYEYGKYASRAESYNRISNLFSLPGNTGFGYSVFNDSQIKICFLSSKDLNGQLKNDDFKALSLKIRPLTFCSVVPVGKMLFTSTLKSDKTISNGHFNISIIKDNSTTIWVIIGVCSAVAMFIALGLGIGIPMRKNARLQLATTKLSNKKIDMLSTTVAKSFKKLAENTNTLLKNQPKVLAATTMVKPVRLQQPIKPVRPKSIEPFKR